MKLLSAICVFIFGDDDDRADAKPPTVSLDKLTISTMAPVASSSCSKMVTRSSTRQSSTPSPCAIQTHPLQEPNDTSTAVPNDEDDEDDEEDDEETTDQTAFLPITALSLAFMYSEMIDSGHWIADFWRGRRPVYTKPKKSKRGTVRIPNGITRTLATRHLSPPCTDGWNVITGAIELARVWGLCEQNLNDRTRDLGEYEIPLQIRMRLAICLNVSFKFQRSTQSAYPRDFFDKSNPTLSPYTQELAHLGFAFLTVAEQAQFGGWSGRNSDAIGNLYKQMMTLEADLVCNVPTFRPLAENVLAVSERRLELFYDRGVRTDEQVMAIRSIIPFFIYATMGSVYESLTRLPTDASAGALVLAAWLAVSSPESGDALFLYSEAVCRVVFTPLERVWATIVLTKACSPSKVVGQLMMLGDFGDAKSASGKYLAETVIQKARARARAIG